MVAYPRSIPESPLCAQRLGALVGIRVAPRVNRRPAPRSELPAATVRDSHLDLLPAQQPHTQAQNFVPTRTQLGDRK
jgi:hypothetical protein